MKAPCVKDRSDGKFCLSNRRENRKRRKIKLYDQKVRKKNSMFFVTEIICHELNQIRVAKNAAFFIIF